MRTPIYLASGFQAAAAITLLDLLGQMLDQRAKAKKRATKECCTNIRRPSQALCCC